VKEERMVRKYRQMLEASCFSKLTSHSQACKVMIAVGATTGTIMNCSLTIYASLKTIAGVVANSALKGKTTIAKSARSIANVAPCTINNSVVIIIKASITGSLALTTTFANFGSCKSS
jgi:hypothetical protein